MNQANDVLNLLEKDEIVELKSNESIVIIQFKEFFQPKKEFNFILNGKSFDGCKTKKTALKKITNFLNNGFSLVEEQ